MYFLCLGKNIVIKIIIKRKNENGVIEIYIMIVIRKFVDNVFSFDFKNRIVVLCIVKKGVLLIFNINVCVWFVVDLFFFLEELNIVNISDMVGDVLISFRNLCLQFIFIRINYREVDFLKLIFNIDVF